MNITEQWQAVNVSRSALYRWFADIFARELTPAVLDDWLHHQAYENMHNVFKGLEMKQESERVKVALNAIKQLPVTDQALELAADFAQLFLLSGEDSAPPYASYYLDSDKQLYGKPAEQMRKFLESQQLSLHPEFREPNDHISVYLMVMSLWIKDSGDEQAMMTTIVDQKEFLSDALLTWLPKFDERCQTIKPSTDFYPALVSLMSEFVFQDKQTLESLAE